MVNHIVKTFLSANEYEYQAGINWYRDAHAFCKELSGECNLPLQKVVGIVAALSPIKSWNENQKIARMFCLTGKHYHTNLCGNKAIAIRDLNTIDDIDSHIEKILSGEKVKAFYHNILYPEISTRVTLDRHALRVAKFHKDTATQKENAAIQKKYQKATERINLLTGENHLPLQIQAVTWIKVRRKNVKTNQTSLAI